MVQASGRPLPAVIDDLLRQPQNYAFAQVVRLLRLWAGPRNAQELEAFMLEQLRFRPELSFGFAASDVTALDLSEVKPHLRRPFRQARITASVLGLYGVSSPLPKFYTEALLAEMTEDRSALRDFLDIINNNFYRMRTGLSSYADPLNRSFSAFDPKARHMLMSLASFGDDSLVGRLPDDLVFLRYAGFFFQATRTASGLRAILADASGCAATHVHCNVPRLAKVPEDQLLRLGRSAVLGEDAVLGDAVPCFEGKIAIDFTMLEESAFRAILPGAPLSRLLHALVRHYCREPLDYAVTAALAPGEALPLRLGGVDGGRFAALGLDAWLGSGGEAPEAPLPKAEALFPAGFCWEDAGET
jgi:type VI secretion system protein ImpH